MKKAKDYAAQYNDNPTDGELIEVLLGFLAEIEELVSARSAKTKGAHCAILDELDRKWQAFARLAVDGGIKGSGFKDFIRAKYPVVYEFWRGKWKDWQPQRSIFPEKIGRRGK